MSRFLLIFSFLILAAVGVIWACADMDESEYSVFTPELFVNKQYSPFFYTGYAVYYGIGYAESSNSQYNEIITNEWYDYFKQQFGKSSLRFLLTTASQGAIDSVYSNFKGESTTLPKPYTDSAQGNPDKKQKLHFLNISHWQKPAKPIL